MLELPFRSITRGLTSGAVHDPQALLEIVTRDDPDLPGRCRAAAEEGFSLKCGTEAYSQLDDVALYQSNGATACAE